MNKKEIAFPAISLSFFIFISPLSTPAFATNKTAPIAGTQLAIYLNLSLSNRRHSDYDCQNCSNQDNQTDERVPNRD